VTHQNVQTHFSIQKPCGQMGPTRWSVCVPVELTGWPEKSTPLPSDWKIVL